MQKDAGGGFSLISKLIGSGATKSKGLVTGNYRNMIGPRRAARDAATARGENFIGTDILKGGELGHYDPAMKRIRIDIRSNASKAGLSQYGLSTKYMTDGAHKARPIDYRTTDIIPADAIRTIRDHELVHFYDDVAPKGFLSRLANFSLKGIPTSAPFPDKLKATLGDVATEYRARAKTLGVSDGIDDLVVNANAYRGNHKDVPFADEAYGLIGKLPHISIAAGAMSAANMGLKGTTGIGIDEFTKEKWNAAKDKFFNMGNKIK